MLRNVVKGYAYAKAPRTTFTVLHPRRAAKLRMTGWDLRHGYAPRIAALGALAVGLPLGYAIGRLVTARELPED